MNKPFANTLNNRTLESIDRFRSGLNCAQAVLTAYCEDFELDYESAMRLSCGFGSGMGRLQGTCGAVTGSYMVLGLYNSCKYVDNKDRKEASYSQIQEFSERFRQIHGSTDCRSILNCDLRTEAGNTFAKENNLFGTVCEKCISDSLSILNELID